MGDYVTIGRADEVHEGDAAAFEVEGAQVAVARVGGALYAFGDICTHLGCTLMAGADPHGTDPACGCQGGVCPIESGAVLAAPATQPIELSPAREVDPEIQIEV